MNEQLKQLQENPDIKNIRIQHLRRGLINGKDIITAPLHTLRLFSQANQEVEILSKGGITTVEISDIYGQTAVGIARCHINDTFNREQGLQKALGLAKANFDVNQRSQRLGLVSE